MTKVRFTKDATVHEGANRVLYDQGKVYSFEDSAAERWLRRGHEVAHANSKASQPRVIDEHGNPVVASADELVDQAEAAERDAAAKAEAEEAARAAVERAEQERIAAEAAAAAAARLAERAAVDIPDDWHALSWPELRSLATELSDETVRSKDDAIAAVEAELKRRRGA